MFDSGKVWDLFVIRQTKTIEISLIISILMAKYINLLIFCQLRTSNLAIHQIYLLCSNDLWQNERLSNLSVLKCCNVQVHKVRS